MVELEATIFKDISKIIFYSGCSISCKSFLFTLPAAPEVFQDKEHCRIRFTILRVVRPKFGHPVQSSEITCKFLILILHGKNNIFKFLNLFQLSNCDIIFVTLCIQKLHKCVTQTFGTQGRVSKLRKYYLILQTYRVGIFIQELNIIIVLYIDSNYNQSHPII